MNTEWNPISLSFSGAAFVGGYAALASAGYPEVHQMAYLGSSLCCVGALAGLSSQKTSRLGNALGMVGVSSGLVATLGLMDIPMDFALQIGGAMGAGTSTLLLCFGLETCLVVEIFCQFNFLIAWCSKKFSIS